MTSYISAGKAYIKYTSGPVRMLTSILAQLFRIVTCNIGSNESMYTVEKNLPKHCSAGNASYVSWCKPGIYVAKYAGRPPELIYLIAYRGIESNNEVRVIFAHIRATHTTGIGSCSVTSTLEYGGRNWSVCLTAFTCARFYRRMCRVRPYQDRARKRTSTERVAGSET